MYDDPRGANREAEKAELNVNIYPNPSMQNAYLTIELDADLIWDNKPVIKVYNSQGLLSTANAPKNKRQTIVRLHNDLSCF